MMKRMFGVAFFGIASADIGVMAKLHRTIKTANIRGATGHPTVGPNGHRTACSTFFGLEARKFSNRSNIIHLRFTASLAMPGKSITCVMVPRPQKTEPREAQRSAGKTFLRSLPTLAVFSGSTNWMQLADLRTVLPFHRESRRENDDT